MALHSYGLYSYGPYRRPLLALVPLTIMERAPPSAAVSTWYDDWQSKVDDGAITI